MKYPYNSTYYPPIPEMTLRILAAESGLATELLSAIVDTGADATIVPIVYLHEIEAAVEDEARLRSPLGDSRIVKLYMVDIQIEDRTLPGILVMGDETGDEVVLGRIVINRMRLLLDGLSEQSEIIYL